jgi:hypothetical protein
LNPSFNNLSYGAGETFTAVSEPASVPEPTSITGVLVAGVLGGIFKKKQLPAKGKDSSD